MRDELHALQPAMAAGRELETIDGERPFPATETAARSPARDDGAPERFRPVWHPLSNAPRPLRAGRQGSVRPAEQQGPAADNQQFNDPGFSYQVIWIGGAV